MLGWLAAPVLPSFFLVQLERELGDGAGKNSVTEMEERKLMTKRERERERGSRGEVGGSGEARQGASEVERKGGEV